MLYLLLTIFVSIGIFLVFKIAGSQKLNPLPIVSINYVVAVISGFFFTPANPETAFSHSPGFYIAACLIGVLFITLFILVHHTTNSSGLAVTSAAAKLSVVFPVALSLIIDPNDTFSFSKLAGFLLLILAFVAILYRGIPKDFKVNILWPVTLFVGMGVVDSLIKLSQQFLIPENSVSNFTLLVFAVAALSGFLVIMAKKEGLSLFKQRSIILGVLLGWFNYGSLYFMIKALNLNLTNSTFLDSSRIFMFNSLGIILVSAFIGVVFYKERLKPVNYFGLLLSVIGFYLVL